MCVCVCVCACFGGACGFTWSRFSCVQAEEDAGSGGLGIIPPVGAPQSDIIAASVASAEAQMDADRKTTALKALQVCLLFLTTWS